MIHFKLSLFTLFALISFSSLDFTFACDDSKKIYKTCSDQTNLYEAAYDEALRSKKLLLITFGFEECPSCQSLHQLISSKAFSSEFNENYLDIGIGMYNEGKIEFTGQLVFDAVSELESPGGLELKTYPYIVVVNPKTQKAVPFQAGSMSNSQIFKILNAIKNSYAYLFIK